MTAADVDLLPYLAVLDRLLARPAWHADAACRGIGTGPFFDQREGVPIYCYACPVSRQCAEAGEREATGWWGGQLATAGEQPSEAIAVRPAVRRRRRLVLDAVIAAGTVGAQRADVEDSLGLTAATASNDLKMLRSCGQVWSSGRGNGVRWFAAVAD